MCRSPYDLSNRKKLTKRPKTDDPYSTCTVQDNEIKSIIARRKKREEREKILSELGFDNLSEEERKKFLEKLIAMKNWPK